MRICRADKSRSSQPGAANRSLKLIALCQSAGGAVLADAPIPASRSFNVYREQAGKLVNMILVAGSGTEHRTHLVPAAGCCGR
jgi:hypothetical protein